MRSIKSLYNYIIACDLMQVDHPGDSQQGGDPEAEERKRQLEREAAERRSTWINKNAQRFYAMVAREVIEYRNGPLARNDWLREPYWLEHMRWLRNPNYDDFNISESRLAEDLSGSDVVPDLSDQFKELEQLEMSL